MFDTIVVPIDDGPESRRALTTGVLLARAWTKPVQLVTVVSPGVDDDEPIRWLEDALEDVDAPARPVVVEHSNDVADALTSIAGTGSLLCMATHARRGLGDLLLGSTAQEVLARSTAPVVLVGPRCAPTGSFESIRVPIRPGSDFSARAVAVAVDWAKGLHAHLELVGAVPPEDMPVIGNLSAALHLRKLVGDASVAGADASWRVVDGDDITTRLLEDGEGGPASLLAVATHARGPLGRLVLGSVAQQLVRRAPCPVLVVPPHHLGGAHTEPS